MFSKHFHLLDWALRHNRGMQYSLNPIDHSIPTALGQDPQAVILKVSKSIRSTREHFHFSMESLCYPI